MDAKFTINIQTDNAVIKEAIAQIEWAITQPELKDYILNFKNRYNFRGFLQSDKSNEWHVTKFFDGNSENNTWSANIVYFDSTTEIIGYTENSNKTINLNNKYLNRSIPEICNTLIHEYCHMVGMVHSLFNPGDTVWAQTAPYAIGSYVQYMVETKLNLPTTKPSFPKVSFFKRLVYKLKNYHNV